MIKGEIISAIKNTEDLKVALNTKVDSIFLLKTNIEIIADEISLAHNAGKKIFVHIDLAEGIGKDEYGVRHLKNLGADGVISTKTNVIKIAKKLGMFTIQRFFIVDSQSIDTTVETVSASKADVIEIMPGILFKVIKRVKDLELAPIVAGGIIETEQEIKEALFSGAIAVSTSKKELWNK